MVFLWFTREGTTCFFSIFDAKDPMDSESRRRLRGWWRLAAEAAVGFSRAKRVEEPPVVMGFWSANPIWEPELQDGMIGKP